MWRLILCSVFDAGIFEDEYAVYHRKCDAVRVGRAFLRSERIAGEHDRWYRIEYVDDDLLAYETLRG